MTAATDTIIRNCVHCGFCTATCPTYVLLGDECDSPRGRIQLIKNMFVKGGAPDAQTVKHIDRCLSCLSCTTTCPSGVDYAHLIDDAREYVEDHYRRPISDRVLRWLLATVLPRPQFMRAAMLFAPLGALVQRFLPKSLSAMVDLAGSVQATTERLLSVYPAIEPRRWRVALLQGCVQDVVARHVHHATIRFLTRHHTEIVIAEKAGCCGALPLHMGRKSAARTMARAAIDAWWSEINGNGLDAIIVNASGCGSALKDYAILLGDDPAYAAKAARVAALACDLSEFSCQLDLRADMPGLPRSIAYHPACSLSHGQKVKAQPKQLLRDLGFDILPIAEDHLCCGSAGTYSILQPEIAGQLRSRKVLAIEATKAKLMVSGNVGCNSYLADRLTMPVINMAELLDWATGGPTPSAVEIALCKQQYQDD
jgi:glycolate oxidase iron-sulfur subunit